MDIKLQHHLDLRVLNASTSTTKNLPPRLASTIYNILLSAPTELFNPKIISELRKIIQNRAIPNYDKYWAAFTYLYYYENFQKAYQAAYYFLPKKFGRSLRILDLGCGGGASTAGLICALKSIEHQQPSIEKVIGVDISNSQLSLFEQTVKFWLGIDQPNIIVETHNQDVIEFLREEKFKADIAIASYVMAEMDFHKKNEFRHLLKKQMKSSGSQILIIDDDTSKESMSIETIDGLIRNLDETFIEKSHSMKLNLINTTDTKKNIAYSSKLLLTYFHAWKTFDTDIIKNIFSKDALYEIIGSKTLYGINEIEDYWKKNKNTQSEVSYQILYSDLTNNGIVSSWTAEFFRTDKNVWYILHGLMWLTIRNRKIINLTESFTKKITETKTMVENNE